MIEDRQHVCKETQWTAHRDLARWHDLSIADLPPATTRWVASRKAVVVNAVVHGLISRDEALRRYNLSEEEFDGWCSAITTHGQMALKVTAIQRFR